VALPLLERHFVELQSASTPTVAVAAVGSFAGQLAAVVQAAPLWVYLAAAVAPWVPLLALEIYWTFRHYRWLALFCVLILSQSGYLLQQVARVVQVDLLGRAPEAAPGIVGGLGIEQVHLLWTTSAALGLLLLASRFRRNRWLWLTLAVAVADALLFERPRPAFELGISVVQIATLNIAFADQLTRTYDTWLARAFPRLPEEVLIEATGQLEEIRLRPGETVEQDLQRWLIVTSGTGLLLRMGPGGHEILLGVLGPGEVVRDPGTVCADTPLELLALPNGAV
jgi:hypothetical protein